MKRMVWIWLLVGCALSAMEQETSQAAREYGLEHILDEVDQEQHDNEWLLEKIEHETGVTFKNNLLVTQLSEQQKMQLVGLLAKRTQSIVADEKKQTDNPDLKQLYHLILMASNNATDYASKSLEEQRKLNVTQAQQLKVQTDTAALYKNQVIWGAIGTGVGFLFTAISVGMNLYQHFSMDEGSTNN